MTILETGYIVVFAASVLFTILTIYRQTKFSAVYATLALVFWWVLAGVNLVFSATEPSLFPLSFLWFALGLIAEILGIVITLQAMKTDSERRDMEI